MSGTRVRPMPQVPCILHTIHVYCILLCVYTSMLHTRQVQVSAYFKVSMRHPAFHVFLPISAALKSIISSWPLHVAFAFG